MPTANAISTTALRRMGITAVGETPSAAALTAGFNALNGLLGTWDFLPLTKASALRTTHSLVSGTASYTIGTGGTINIVRPQEIVKAGLILDDAAATPSERGVHVMRGADEWASVAQKTLAGAYVDAIYYEKSWASGLGRIYVHPIPNVSNTDLVLYTPLSLVEFALQTTDISFHSGVLSAIEWNLAKELCAEYPIPVEEVVKIASVAREKLDAFLFANVMPAELTFDRGLAIGGRGRGDYRTG